jgi:hypothetical protein
VENIGIHVQLCGVTHSSMRDKSLFCWAVGGLLVVCCFLLLSNRAVEEKQRRAELHFLNVIQGQIYSHLVDSGGQLPTDWTSLSNAVNWKMVAGICEYNHLPPPTELYTVLPQPIDFDSYHRSIFLVRSKSRGWPAMKRGRWVVGVGFRWPGQPFFNGDSNRVSRAWVPDGYLPAQVQSQLTMSIKK